MKLRDLFKKKNRWSKAEKLIDQEKEKKRAFDRMLHDLVYNYKTKSEYGFVASEQKELLKQFPDINMEKYEDALCGITCMMNEETNELIIYHCDILTALHCGLENRDMYSHEWD